MSEWHRYANQAHVQLAAARVLDVLLEQGGSVTGTGTAEHWTYCTIRLAQFAYRTEEVSTAPSSDATYRRYWRTMAAIHALELAELVELDYEGGKISRVGLCSEPDTRTGEKS